MADKKTEIPADIKKMSFEDALEELKALVQKLESGEGKLDEAIESYARGAQLKAHCEAKLSEAQAKIEKITFKSDGGVTTEPLDED